jgi:hypothetical protein
MRRDALVDLLEGYDRSQPCDGKAAWLAAKLGMQLPTSAKRQGNCQTVGLYSSSFLVKLLPVHGNLSDGRCFVTSVV